MCFGLGYEVSAMSVVTALNYLETVMSRDVARCITLFLQSPGGESVR